MTTQSFNPLYPMLIHKYEEFIPDQNASVIDKINSIIQTLNQVGTLTNDVVKDWNTVYQWCMNDGLQTDVNNKIDEELAKGTFDAILTSLFTPVVGDLTTLQTADKGNLVAAINDLQAEADSNKNLIGDLTTLTTADKGNLVAAVNDNVASLAQNTSQITNLGTPIEKYGAVGDGVTDDTNAFLSAIQAQGTFKLSPIKTYLIDTIRLSNITIYGNNATLKFKNTTTTIGICQLANIKDINISTPSGYAGSIFTVDTQYNDRYILNSSVENILVDKAYNYNTDTTQAKGISCIVRGSSTSYGFCNVKFKNITLNTALKYGIYTNVIFENNNQPWVTNTLFDDFWINYAAYPIYMDYTNTTAISAYIIQPIFRNIAAQCNTAISQGFAYIKMMSHSKFINCTPFDYDQIANSIIQIEPTYVYSLFFDLIGCGDLVTKQSKIFNFVGSTNTVPYNLNAKLIVYQNEGSKENAFYMQGYTRSTIESNLIGSNALAYVTDTQSGNGYGSGFNGILITAGNAYSNTTMQGAFEIGTNNRGELMYRYHNGTAWSNFANLPTISRASIDRPTNSVTGSPIFDTTLGKPIWWNGTAFINANNVQPGNVGINTAVSASATTLTVTLPTSEANTNYGVDVTPAWNTTYWVTGKSTGQFTINFGTAPASATTLDWSIKR